MSAVGPLQRFWVQGSRRGLLADLSGLQNEGSLVEGPHNKDNSGSLLWIPCLWKLLLLENMQILNLEPQLQALNLKP